MTHTKFTLCCKLGSNRICCQNALQACKDVNMKNAYETYVCLYIFMGHLSHETFFKNLTVQVIFTCTCRKSKLV